MSANRSTLTYSGWSVVPVAVTASVLASLMGRYGFVVAGVLALPWLAWRYDNETGVFLPLAVLVLLVFFVLALLLFLLAIALH